MTKQHGMPGICQCTASFLYKLKHDTKCTKSESIMSPTFLVASVTRRNVWPYLGAKCHLFPLARWKRKWTLSVLQHAVYVRKNHMILSIHVLSIIQIAIRKCQVCLHLQWACLMLIHTEKVSFSPLHYSLIMSICCCKYDSLSIV